MKFQLLSVDVRKSDKGSDNGPRIQSASITTLDESVISGLR